MTWRRMLLFHLNVLMLLVLWTLFSVVVLPAAQAWAVARNEPPRELVAIYNVTPDETDEVYRMEPDGRTECFIYQFGPKVPQYGRSGGISCLRKEQP